MSVLAISAHLPVVTAVVVDPSGAELARGKSAVAVAAPRPGWAEVVPEDLWQATLAAVREVLAVVDPTSLEAVRVAGEATTVLLWDEETLGAPRPGISSRDSRSADVAGRLAWLAEHEPHTWALVRAGRYVLGPVGSYLLARMTRGLWHVIDADSASATGLLDPATGSWSQDLCAAAGVPVDALPVIVPSSSEVGVTDPRTFLGLSVPVTARMLA